MSKERTSWTGGTHGWGVTQAICVEIYISKKETPYYPNQYVIFHVTGGFGDVTQLYEQNEIGGMYLASLPSPSNQSNAQTFGSTSGQNRLPTTLRHQKNTDNTGV